MIKRVLMVMKNRGEGTDDDPVRNVMFFYDEKSLDLICEYDPVMEQIANEYVIKKLKSQRKTKIAR